MNEINNKNNLKKTIMETIKKGFKEIAISQQQDSFTEAKDFGIAISGKEGIAKSGNFGISISGESGESSSKEYGISISGDYGESISGEYGIAISGQNGAVSVGSKGAVIVEQNGSAKGDIGSALIFLIRDEDGYIIGAKTIIVGINGYLPNNLYKITD